MEPKRPQPAQWLRLERSTVDFEAARARARARDPALDPHTNRVDEHRESGEEDGWRSWMPEWLPIKRVAPGEQLERLRARLDEVDALLRPPCAARYFL